MSCKLRIVESRRGNERIKGEEKKWSLNLYPMVCVMLVCCAGDKGEEQLAAWTLF
jgi:hypothetical protein